MANPRRSSRRTRQSRQRRKSYHVRQTHKRDAFLHQMFGAKRVQSLPGIGPTYGRMLRVCGYMKANRVIKRYLKLKNDKQAFIKWLRKATGASEYHASICFEGVRRWCRQHEKMLKSKKRK